MTTGVLRSPSTVIAPLASVAASDSESPTRIVVSAAICSALGRKVPGGDAGGGASSWCVNLPISETSRPMPISTAAAIPSHRHCADRPKVVAGGSVSGVSVACMMRLAGNEGGAEDDRGLADALTAAMVQRGLTVDLATDAEEAEAYLATAGHAAVLLDLGLPDDDGLAVLRRMRARGNTCPVLVLTARGGVDVRIRGLNDGADDILVKPFDPDELHARILAVLRRQGGYLGNALACGASG
ncbi:hypothetical protein WR25_26037 [Diploscapter pachys]|uniref:Response regulatory domain-containing protein n=1 Tax=Diploscapter pachys TaxID=2018661 RepID=A0A2A2KAS8_9BILA|nr:hypothetical protein WR25_26037 [Diploscapter pachys]